MGWSEDDLAWATDWHNAAVANVVSRRISDITGTRNQAVHPGNPGLPGFEDVLLGTTQHTCARLAVHSSERPPGSAAEGPRAVAGRRPDPQHQAECRQPVRRLHLHGRLDGPRHLDSLRAHRVPGAMTELE
jgi:hypothetical protein